MKKNVGRLWLLMLFVGLAFSLQSAYAEEIYGSDCSNGVKWEYSDGLFTLYNVGVFSDSLTRKRSGCIPLRFSDLQTPEQKVLRNFRH